MIPGLRNSKFRVMKIRAYRGISGKVRASRPFRFSSDSKSQSQIRHQFVHNAPRTMAVTLAITRFRGAFLVVAACLFSSNLFITLNMKTGDEESTLLPPLHTEKRSPSNNSTGSVVARRNAALSAAATETSPDISHNSKTLVIIIGNIRGGEKAWKTLYEQVLDVNSADLALMIGETRPEYQNSSLFGRAAYHWTTPEFDDWGEALDLINGTAWRETVMPLMHPHSSILGGVNFKKFQGSGAVIFMIRWFLSQKIQELKLTEKYDRFIITRSDHYYLCRHDISHLSNEYLWTPKGSDCGGITDRHLIVSNKYVLKALNVLPLLLERPEKYEDILRIRSGNPEKVLWKSWKLQLLKDRHRRFERMMFTCGEDGDMTRWKKLGELVEEGVRLKYMMEYNISHATCDYRSSLAH
jgi:hypothetical protein